MDEIDECQTLMGSWFHEQVSEKEKDFWLLMVMTVDDENRFIDY